MRTGAVSPHLKSEETDMTAMFISAALVILGLGALAWHASTLMLELQDGLGPAGPQSRPPCMGLNDTER
jgi:hypothetical protein